MGLTSKKIVLLVVVLALLLFGATVWLWPRLARRGVGPVLGRVAILAATQLAMIAALGLAANYSFGFYASWADLFGRETTPGVVVDDATGGAARQLRVDARLVVNVPGGSVARVGGELQRVTLGGGVSGISATAYVYLPPEYFREPRRTFPAAVVLTGYPGVARALYQRMRYPAIAAEQVRRGQEQPMVLVMLRPTVVPPRDTECVNVPRGPQTETFFARDLRTAVLAHYRVGAGARSWGIIGDSTGGYCALKLALQDPRSYSAAVGLSADYAAPEDPTTGDLFGGSAAVRRANDLDWRLRHLRRPPVSLLVTSSRHGEHNYRSTLRFIGLVKGPTRVSSIILPTGGHNFTTWAREIPASLRWLAAHLVPDAPGPAKAGPTAPGRVVPGQAVPGQATRISRVR
ncbi:S-formylglutathione hydrolase FrmB [Streptomyces sp. DvalAA-14]|uniref:alpha/beta hydrolase n=1 Tax=unclassified Streptomyces TaxID=2593676 RepID=UPI00081BC380|nr:MULTISPECIES: alpha/beta hydrolase-fold protein [unclassified Streptomyces]MYS20590.1 esterase [Streptomyces sp. SID4948]SCD72397.1 S-formylglutathione hydrolase FrmB [Streptomyces sp. DvalAA-14]